MNQILINPIASKYNNEQRLLHGGDYNPDQWLNYPEILADDIELMQKAHTNTFSVSIFAWSALESTEGNFHFDWLDKIIENIAKIDGNVILATPSGARPAWLSASYPEVLRVNARRERMLHGGRHNHCFSSPVYREKVEIINTKLAERYGNYPSLLMWHISNEYGGECHCPLCQENFRNWLKVKYGDINTLNHAYWSAFWSHTYNDFSQVESPSPIGESGLHGLTLDWKRFVSDQTINFYRHEIAPLRKITPNIPITTNFMGEVTNPHPFAGLDYAKFAKEVDIISWDAYPRWHNDYETTEFLASKLAFLNDYFRTLKDIPFLVLESTPSMVNWHPVNKAKRPGMHMLSSMACIAHGSDSMMYFQWRKSRGSSEKLHGAVVDHDNSAENRVFKDVAAVGQALEKIPEIKGSKTPAKVAVLYDVENLWALSDAQGYHGGMDYNDKKYPQTLHAHYRAFWKRDIPIDVVTKDKNLTKYDLVIAPMLYMTSEETMEKLAVYVEGGGRLVSTYMLGVANENDLVHLGGFPQKLRDVFGIRIVETDTLYPKDRNAIMWGGKQYEAFDYCAIIETCGARTLGTYADDFYSRTPAVTMNGYGEGFAHFIGARTNEDFLDDFYNIFIEKLGLSCSLISAQDGVSVQMRENGENIYYFAMNFTEKGRQMTLETEMQDMLSGKMLQSGIYDMKPYGVHIFKNNKLKGC